jgi:hypothetical protein
MLRVLFIVLKSDFSIAGEDRSVTLIAPVDKFEPPKAFMSGLCRTKSLL